MFPGLSSPFPFDFKTPMSSRRRAREVVLQLLYEDDLNPEQNVEVAKKFLSKRLHGNAPIVRFALSLWRSVLENRWELDKAISAKAANWSIRRMAAIDRNVLRLGAYEILMTDTPGRVVINEAVELAKRFGNRQSGQFVNGILDRLLHASEEASESAEASEEATQTEQVSNDGAAGDQQVSAASGSPS